MYGSNSMHTHSNVLIIRKKRYSNPSHILNSVMMYKSKNTGPRVTIILLLLSMAPNLM